MSHNCFFYSAIRKNVFKLCILTYGKSKKSLMACKAGIGKTCNSPYFWGMCIGLLQIPSFFSYGSLGASTPYEKVSHFFKLLYEAGDCMACLNTEKEIWQVGIVLGLILGAFLGKKLGGYQTSSMDPSWRKLMSSYSTAKRLSFAFIGGFIMILGARLAMGCTSGNGISGMSLLFLGSYLVMGSMFLFGTLTALTFYRRS